MPNRREFMTSLAASVIVRDAFGLGSQSSASGRAGINLIPDRPSGAPHYWCTWAVQNYRYGQGFQDLDTALLEGDAGATLARTTMTEKNLFGEDGWTSLFFDRVREDLYFMLDDGWEVGGTATFQLDPAKFPSFAGSSPERLGRLNDAIRKNGWRGAALWCRNTPEGDAMRQLETLTSSAGIRYWKIDLGDPAFGSIRVRDADHVPLTLEHVHGEQPVNGDWQTDGRFGTQSWDSRRMMILRNTDVYRTYDVTSILSLPTTLDRLAAMLQGAQGHSKIGALLNVEDEVYVACVMGCTMGIMRHPLVGKRPHTDVDLFFNGPRQTKRRMDEVVRALRWQRIAPPFTPGVGKVFVDETVLVDGWTFERSQTWQTNLVGATVRQGAPARISRNLPLPEVKCSGEKPFVFATRFPNGAVAIAAQERTRIGHAWYMPECNVTLHVSDAPGPFGIFGKMNSLTITLDTPLHGRRILAQDLAAEEAFDITEAVRIGANTLHVPGSIIQQIGLHQATPGDLSAPGLVVALS
jgi:hypothetical protein